MPNKYKFSLSWSDEDEGYIATCPEFNGLSAFGETAEEALAEAQIALKLFIESYEAKGLALPAPEKVKSHSGQIRLRLPKTLHAQAAGLAAADGVSLNDYLTLAVQHKVTAHQVGDRFVREMRKEIALTTSEERMTLDLNWRSSTSVNPGDGKRRLDTKKSGQSVVH